DKEVRIIFRNMSEYPLELTGEELQERFVRGDKSRHMEGSGLGLSIAGSLMELQHGKMEIITDGDLFKVVLTFANQK
nr:sensor histidine kinase [Acetatifactor sp.]